jgi:hypothetical protein
MVLRPEHPIIHACRLLLNAMRAARPETRDNQTPAKESKNSDQD